MDAAKRECFIVASTKGVTPPQNCFGF